MQTIKNDLEEIKTEADALDQSMALNRILAQLLEDKRRERRMMLFIIALSLLANIIICAMFIHYENQFVEDTVTITTQEVSGEGSDINNVQGDQYNDRAMNISGGGVTFGIRKASNSYTNKKESKLFVTHSKKYNRKRTETLSDMRKVHEKRLTP